jgi:hypothetical protein
MGNGGWGVMKAGDFRSLRDLSTIQAMKAAMPQPEHISYKKHRKQVLTQIYLPVVIALLLVAVLVSIIVDATYFQGGGELSRWAAISTMWIILPGMAAGLFFLTLLIVLIFVLARALQITPRYTDKAQYYVFRARTFMIRAADLLVRPILAVDGLTASIRAFFKRPGRSRIYRDLTSIILRRK